MSSIINSLISGPPTYPFSGGLHNSLPLASCGAYTIWNASQFLYVGAAGRKLGPWKIATEISEGLERPTRQSLARPAVR